MQIILYLFAIQQLNTNYLICSSNCVQITNAKEFTDLLKLRKNVEIYEDHLFFISLKIMYSIYIDIKAYIL